MKNYSVTGLLFGDEGKGATIDALTTRGVNTVVIKSSGGAQNAHNVMHDGMHHTFAQVGSGTFNGCPTYLSEFFVINPSNLWRELSAAPHLSGMFAHPMAVVTTEYHRAANRAREDARGDARHGSTAQGIGEAIVDSRAQPDSVIRACMLPDGKLIHDMLLYWRDEKRKVIESLGQPVPGFFESDELLDQYVEDFTTVPLSVVDNTYLAHWRKENGASVVFEGGQGVLLDEHVGFFPHVCWGRTTPTNAEIIAEKIGVEFQSWGVMRAYMTRHGAGPLPTEDSSLDYRELHNGTGKYQGAFRLGHLDLMLLDYSLMMSKIDVLAVNHLDLVAGDRWNRVPVCVGYREMEKIPAINPYDFEARSALTEQLKNVTPIYEMIMPEHLIGIIETRTGLNVKILGYGPHREERRWRHWPSSRLAKAFTQPTP